MPSKLPLLVAMLLFSCLLLAAGSGQAAPAPPAPLAFQLEEEELGEDEEEAALAREECEYAEQELEEGLLDESDVEILCEGLAEESESPAATEPTTANRACPLRSARAHAAIGRDRLKLTIGYTTAEPTRATFVIRRGGRRLGAVTRQLRRSGVVRVTRKLRGRRRGRISVRIKLPSHGATCPPGRLLLLAR